MTACRYDINGEGGGNGSGSGCCASLHCLNVKSERERVMKGKGWNEMEKERGMTKEMSADSKLFLSNILL